MKKNRASVKKVEEKVIFGRYIKREEKNERWWRKEGDGEKKRDGEKTGNGEK